MSTKTKSIIRKIIYGILFTLMIGAFIYLSDKYANNNEEVTKTIVDYYNDIKSDKFEVVKGSQLQNIIKNEKSLIFIGSYTSDYSKKYIEELNSIINTLKIEKVYYYDLNNDKSQKNSSYYAIKELLKGNLISTDGSNNNLLAPSFYIIENGEVKYYNIETVAMKNTDSLENYWTEEKIEQFKEEITAAINKYYLNK